MVSMDFDSDRETTTLPRLDYMRYNHNTVEDATETIGIGRYGTCRAFHQPPFFATDVVKEAKCAS